MIKTDDALIDSFVEALPNWSREEIARWRVSSYTSVN